MERNTFCNFFFLKMKGMIAFHLNAVLFLTCLVQHLTLLKLCLKARVGETNQFEEGNEVR